MTSQNCSTKKSGRLNEDSMNLFKRDIVSIDKRNRSVMRAATEDFR
jgi:hypothetical protein